MQSSAGFELVRLELKGSTLTTWPPPQQQLTWVYQMPRFKKQIQNKNKNIFFNKFRQDWRSQSFASLLLVPTKQIFKVLDPTQMSASRPPSLPPASKQASLANYFFERRIFFRKICFKKLQNCCRLSSFLLPIEAGYCRTKCSRLELCWLRWQRGP